MIRLLVADDHQIFLDGMTALLDNEPDVTVSGLVLNGQQVLDHLGTHPVDVVLMDVNMPELDGIKATEQIRQQYPDVKVLVLTMHNSPEFIEKLMEAGADGYVLKNIGRAQLLEAIKKLKDGGSYYDQHVSATILESYHHAQEPHRGEEAELTRRELDVLRLICQGGSTEQISRKLSISFYTVEAHRNNLFSKFNVHSCAELIQYAINEGLI